MARECLCPRENDWRLLCNMHPCVKTCALEIAGVLASVSQLHTPSCPQKALQKLQLDAELPRETMGPRLQIVSSAPSPVFRLFAGGARFKTLFKAAISASCQMYIHEDKLVVHVFMRIPFNFFL